ncbi:UNVERIFIED_CONTAM: Leucine-rich repeat receptor-like protein kinase TDR [Sesamum radiatum]|uniref:non-specific serine/threonine protein kinase n=1 Tax=Sesamum radiatum TaxID=300843 RepID=A0AAW2JV32_SESRA
MNNPFSLFLPLAFFSLFLILIGAKSLVVSTTAVEVAAASSPPLELLSLLSIKSSLKDPVNTFHDWDPTTAFSRPGFQPVWCSWPGVRCDRRTNQVTSLDLSGRNLSGSISTDIRYLSHLHHLNLSKNSFVGPLQAAIFELPNLRILDINHNFFNSSFSPGMSKLKSLTFLNAYSNSFTGPLPEELIYLKNLEYLNLGGSYFEGEIPSSYGKFSKLKSLYLHGNSLTGRIPAELAFLNQLEHMELGYNSYTGGLPVEFASLSNLVYLDISSANLSGNLPAEFGRLRKLEILLLFRNNLSGSIPVNWAQLESIQILDLSDNNLSGEIPGGFSALKELNTLSLMNNNLTGEIPEGIGELPNLEVLSLWNNSLSGILPQKLGSNAKLQRLDVSTNSLTGPIPPNLCLKQLIKLMLFSNQFVVKLEFLNISENPFNSELPDNIWSAPSIQIFSASSSNLNGKIPDFIGCRSFYKIELDGNNLSGSIPWDIGHCEKLICLNLRRNSLTGIIPWEISALPSITDVDLSHNFLTGAIPSNFNNCSTLENFNVSYNQLTGPVPSSGLVFSSLHPSSFSGNEGLCGAILNKTCRTEAPEAGAMDVPRPPKKTAGAIVWIMAAAFGIGLVILIAGSRCFRATYGRKFSTDRDVGPWKLTAFQRLNFTADDVLECLNMTDKIIGMGSTGTVYKAEMPGGEIIAVKKLWGKHKDTIRKRRGVLAEVDVLGNVRHRNIVRLLGCCSKTQCTMLLYEYMPNGSLDDLLHGKNKGDNLVADWVIRYKIALGVAQGICYLHHDCDPVIVHRDLKPSNILLDAEMEARVADFGVAKLIQSDESMSVIAGSYGYIAQYAYTLQVDEKSDIYSYGVVLMEILTGKRSVHAEFGDGNSIVDWVKTKIKTKNGLSDVLDKNAGASCASVREEMMLLLRVALLCTSRNPADRPSMRDVVSMLHEAKPKRKLPGSGGGAGSDNMVDGRDFPEPQKPVVEC